MQTAYTYGYRDLIKMFFTNAKRIEKHELQKMIANVNTNVVSIYNLRAEVQGILDFLEDYQQTEILRMHEFMHFI